MPYSLTTLTLVALTLLSLAGCVVAIYRLRRPRDTAQGTRDAASQPTHAADRLQSLMVGLVGLGAAALFVYRWAFVHGRWQPLAAHVDGLLLIAALFSAAIVFIQWRPRLYGLSAFAMPLLSLILAWAICASAWTYHPFQLETLHPVWMALHLIGVYLGTLGSAVAAIAGGMFLYIQRRLKQKANLDGLGRLASLEALETLIIRSATLGFVLLTLGLIAGIVILSGDDPGMSLTWGYSWKIALAAAAWLVYALLMNLRYATHFRGARAAWLAITGLVLLLATYGIVTSNQVQRPKSQVHSPESIAPSPKSQVRSPKSRVQSPESRVGSTDYGLWTMDHGLIQDNGRWTMDGKEAG